MGQNDTDELKASLRQRFTTFADSKDRQNRVTAVDSIVKLVDNLLDQDAKIPEHQAQRQREAVQQAAKDGQGILGFGISVCMLALVLTITTVLWGSTPGWTLLIGVPTMLGLAGFVVTFGDEVAEHKIVKDPQRHVAVCWMLAALTAGAGLVFVLAALVWPTSIASWVALATMIAPIVITVQTRRPESHEQPYRTTARS